MFMNHPVVYLFAGDIRKYCKLITFSPLPIKIIHECKIIYKIYTFLKAIWAQRVMSAPTGDVVGDPYHNTIKLNIVITEKALIMLLTQHKFLSFIKVILTNAFFFSSKYCIPHLKKSSNAHILNISPPLLMESRWFKNHVGKS